jgi:hypothetical protein
VGEALEMYAMEVVSRSKPHGVHLERVGTVERDVGVVGS